MIKAHSRHVALLAFTPGDGIPAAHIPLVEILIAERGAAVGPSGKWFRFIWPISVIISLIAGIFSLVVIEILYRK